MTEKSLAQRIDEFELELSCIEALIDILYTAPPDHPYRMKYMEELHTHRLNIREKYNNIRWDVVFKAVS